LIEAMTVIEARLPVPLVGLDTDNGGKFINHPVIKWAGDRELFLTRSRPYNSTIVDIEQKNGDVVRRHAFRYRYDTARELQLLGELYTLVRVRSNCEHLIYGREDGWRALSRRLCGQQVRNLRANSRHGCRICKVSDNGEQCLPRPRCHSDAGEENRLGGTA
jgi:hypothetical protein